MSPDRNLRVAFLSTADWLVDDPRSSASRLARVLQSPAPRDEDMLAHESHPFASQFARTSTRPWREVPTRLQFIAVSELRPVPGCHASPSAGLLAAQRGRPQRVHGTVLVVHELATTLDDLRARAVPVFVEEPCHHFDWRRVWVGWTSDGVRCGGFDAGVFVELVPVEAFGASIADAARRIRRDDLADSPRVVARTFLVGDLDDAARQLRRSLGLEPHSTGTELLGEQIRWSRYRFEHAGSADLVLATPAAPGAVADELQQNGPGLLATTIAGPDAAGARTRAIELGFRPRGSRLLEDPGSRALFDFVDLGGAAA